MKFAIAGILALASIAAQAETPVFDMINLEASAQASVTNDLMRATLFVEADNKDPAALAAEITRTLNQSLKAAQAFAGVKAASGMQSTWPVHDAKNKLVAWRSRAEIQMESQNFDAMARAIAKIQSVMQTGNITFVLSPEAADARSNVLIETAITAFRKRADLIARSLGAANWKIVNLNINTSNNRPPMPFMRAMPMKAMAAEDMPVQDMAGGESDITVMLNGTIQLLR